MVWRIAVGCNSNSFVPNRVKSSFYGLPKDDTLKKKWLQNIKRENLPKDKKLCHLHFTEDCFERDMRVIKYFS